MNFAYRCAEDAQENFFSSRRGIWDYEREGLFVLYDNNPTRAKSIRARAIALIHEALAAQTVRVLGEAYYPLFAKTLATPGPWSWMHTAPARTNS